ncbi:siderophore-interacting protein [Pelagibacterium luteolum]|uniref:NADPH-dependent ferric siderophore reductase, contains FAD-binding and SIP domains n=1 Tax=Pelagibacterium luteolum TaxID=440168 RepID=A0A1G7WVF5_9HYPH|nr:siderophore-interacting protein [Pelagibacterium luteolum]SDG75866.1 NADPH-dependent ferric siderophore reductase, contains FAD-binding and SIP domains [Pelagibacterium luteolum]
MSALERGAKRVRHELKFRIGTVVSSERITPKMARITLSSEDFASFVSLAYDDHCKLFFPETGQRSFPTPERGPDGLIFPDGMRPQSRDYTPRAYDTDAKLLTLDFVLHGDGPASSWAEAAKPGDTIGVGGPRGSFVLEGEFDWYLLVGDETALPAIGRRLEELPRDAKALAVIEVSDESEIQAIDAPDGARVQWLSRGGAQPGDAARLLAAVKALSLPEGDGYVFVAGENRMSKAVREYFVDERGHDPDWIKAAGYWQAGAEDFDDGHAH